LPGWGRAPGPFTDGQGPGPRGRRGVKSLAAGCRHAHDAYGLLAYAELHTIEDLSVPQAAALMSRYRLNRLVVVEGNRLVGLLAMNDILARLMDDLA
jgi:predicted transcriptional regulator